MRAIVVGGGRVGRGLAERLEDRGENVVVVDIDGEAIETARSSGFSAYLGDGTDTGVLEAAGIENAKVVAAATANDDANLLIAQLASASYDVETVIARVNTPDNVDAFEEVGVHAVSANDAVAHEMDNAIERPALSEWMTELGRTGDVQETEVTADELVGRSVSELDEQFPDGVLVALVSRGGDSRIPEPGLRVRAGDHLTFVGRRDAVREAIERCQPNR